MSEDELLELEPAVLTPYIYKAEVISIYDGDTMVLQIDLGFDIKHRITVRLARINAPEVRGESRLEGFESRDFLIDTIFGESGPADNTVVIKTYKDKKEKYGRYLADIFLDGVCLNDELVKNGLAVYKEY